MENLTFSQSKSSCLSVLGYPVLHYRFYWREGEFSRILMYVLSANPLCTQRSAWGDNRFRGNLPSIRMGSGSICIHESQSIQYLNIISSELSNFTSLNKCVSDAAITSCCSTKCQFRLDDSFDSNVPQMPVILLERTYLLSLITLTLKEKQDNIAIGHW